MNDKQLQYADVILRNPGLVENSEAAEHCVHACFQMIFRSRIGGAVPSFDELDVMMQKVPGKYTYEWGLLARMPGHGFDTRIIWTHDLHAVIEDAAGYFRSQFGDEIGEEYIRNSDLAILQAQARELLDSDVVVDRRTPGADELVGLLADGYYVTVTINQRVLQADPGYVAHSILLYGAGRLGPIFHNPGPPATEATQVPWELFDRAWSYPTVDARNIMALRPER